MGTLTVPDGLYKPDPVTEISGWGGVENVNADKLQAFMTAYRTYAYVAQADSVYDGIVPYTDIRIHGADTALADNYDAFVAACNVGIPVYVPWGIWKMQRKFVPPEGTIMFAKPSNSISKGAILLGNAAITDGDNTGAVVSLENIDCTLMGVNINGGGSGKAQNGLVIKHQSHLFGCAIGNGSINGYRTAAGGVACDVMYCTFSQGAGPDGTTGLYHGGGTDGIYIGIRVSAPNLGTGVNYQSGWAQGAHFHVTGKGQPTGSATQYLWRTSGGQNSFYDLYLDTGRTHMLFENGAHLNVYDGLKLVNVGADGSVGGVGPQPIILFDSTGGQIYGNRLENIIIDKVAQTPGVVSWFWQEINGVLGVNSLGSVHMAQGFSLGSGLFSGTKWPLLTGPLIDGTGAIYGYQPHAFVTLADGAPINWDWTQGDHFKLTTSNNRVINNPANAQKGWQTTLQLHNSHATLAITPTWGANIKFPAAGPPTIAVGKERLLTFRYDGTNFYMVRDSGDI